MSEHQWTPQILERLRRQVERPSLWMQIKRRRRVARPLAAWHLVRHGSVIYGAHFSDTIQIKRAPRRLLVSQCFVDRTGEDVATPESETK